jgi:hypothetical protein
MGFIGVNWDSPGLLDARDPNCVVHCVVGDMQRKLGAVRVAGAPSDRDATRDALLRSIVTGITNVRAEWQLKQQRHTREIELL